MERGLPARQAYLPRRDPAGKMPALLCECQVLYGRFKIETTGAARRQPFVVPKKYVSVVLLNCKLLSRRLKAIVDNLEEISKRSVRACGNFSEIQTSICVKWKFPQACTERVNCVSLQFRFLFLYSSFPGSSQVAL